MGAVPPFRRIIFFSNFFDSIGYDISEKTNLVQNVPTKQNLFSKFARNVKIKTKEKKTKERVREGLGEKTKQTDKAFVS